MRFLGTSAGEGTPTPFCRCNICENARKVGGKELRLRSAFRLDKSNAIDLGHDSVACSQKLNEDFYDIKNIFYTHTHDDHFDFNLIWTRSVSPMRLQQPINLFFSNEGARVFEEYLYRNKYTESTKSFTSGEFTKINVLELYKETDCGDYYVTAIKGFHKTSIESYSNNYVFRSKESGKVLLYALDTSLYPDEELDKLRGLRFDTVITECTFPFIKEAYDGDLSNHMDAQSAIRFFDKLYSINAIGSGTKIYITHIAPFGATHAELCEFFSCLDRPYKVTVAYDGLYVE